MSASLVQWILAVFGGAVRWKFAAGGRHGLRKIKERNGIHLADSDRRLVSIVVVFAGVIALAMMSYVTSIRRRLAALAVSYSAGGG